MFGTISHEMMEVKVGAKEAWELYSTLRLAKLIEKELSFILNRIDLVEGDGGVGTVLNLVFAPGVAAFESYKEKFTKIDKEKRVKEAEVVEGGYLYFGFTLYRVRFEVIEKAATATATATASEELEEEEDCCITKSTIEYELNDESSANASMVSIQALATIMEVASTHLLKNKYSNANPN